jgi:hypothetical protein
MCDGLTEGGGKRETNLAKGSLKYNLPIHTQFRGIWGLGWFVNKICHAKVFFFFERAMLKI